MCFSATMSLGAAAGIAAIGCVGVRAAAPRRSRFLAAIPFLFAAQQAAEGVVWLTLDDPHSAALHRAAVLAYLGFALAVWPLWMPAALLVAERDAQRQRRLRALAWVGFAVAIAGIAFLLHWPSTASVSGCSIRYRFAWPVSPLVGAAYGATYTLASVAPFFASTERWAKTMGVGLLVSLLGAMVLAAVTFTSVFCFFAAVESAIIVAGVTGWNPLPIRVARG